MKTSSIAIGFVSAALLWGQAWALETDYAAGTRALPLVQEAGTARAMAMGSAVVALSQGSASLLWNPAALSRMSSKEIGLHHNTDLGNTGQGMAINGLPLGKIKEDGTGGSLGGLAGSVGYVNNGSFSGTDAFGQPTGNYSAGGYSGSLGWGMELLPGLSGGLVLKDTHSTFAARTYDALTTDIGLLWKVSADWNLGAAYSNLGGKVGNSRLVSGWRLGAAWTASKRWLLAASTEGQTKGMGRISGGAEYLIGNIELERNILALRAGYQLNIPNPQLIGLTSLTLGLGYAVTHSIALDYAFVPAGELGSSHLLSVTVKFNPRPIAVVIQVFGKEHSGTL